MCMKEFSNKIQTFLLTRVCEFVRCLSTSNSILVPTSWYLEQGLFNEIMVDSSGTLHTRQRILIKWSIQMKVMFDFQEVLNVVINVLTEAEVNATDAQKQVYLEATIRVSTNGQ